MLSQALLETKLLLAKCHSSGATSEDKDDREDRLDSLVRNMVDTVETIVSCTTHQKRITDDILSLSKLDSNLLEICPSIWKVDNFLQQIESTFKIEAAQVGVQLEVISDSSLQELGVDWVEADSGRLLQVIVNLATNAIKFTKDQTGARIVTVCLGASLSLSTGFFTDLVIPRLETVQGEVGTKISGNEFYLCCSVKDTGCGMDAAGRTRIFSRFSQASPKTYNKYGGSGLGLFISQKLASLQGGQIGYTSEQDAGSTFAVSIKASKALPIDSPLLGPTTPAGRKGKTVQPTCSNSFATDRKRPLAVLLVEDNQINQKVLGKQLRYYGYVVHTANHGQDAFDFIKTTEHWKGRSEPGDSVPHIDVILMDIEMPVIDGLECSKMIRSAQKAGSITKHLPIIAVTANARPEQLKRAVEAGMDDAVTKPFRMQDLIPIISRLVLF